jgi:hypothetical protein
MMCLGWKQQKACNDIGPSSVCPDITWFWLGLAIVGAGALFSGKDKKESAAAAA